MSAAMDAAEKEVRAAMMALEAAESRAVARNVPDPDPEEGEPAEDRWEAGFPGYCFSWRLREGLTSSRQ